MITSNRTVIFIFLTDFGFDPKPLLLKGLKIFEYNLSIRLHIESPHMLVIEVAYLTLYK